MNNQWKRIMNQKRHHHRLAFVAAALVLFGCGEVDPLPEATLERADPDCDDPAGCAELPDLLQARYHYENENFPFGYRSIDVMRVTQAPADADPERWAMTHDGNVQEDDGTYRLFHLAAGRDDTLYRFTWDGSTYRFDREFDIDLKSYGEGLGPALDTSQFAITHGNVNTLLQLWFLSESGDRLVPFFLVDDEDTFRVAAEARDGYRIDTSDVDMRGWAMVGVGGGSSPAGEQFSGGLFLYAWDDEQDGIVEFTVPLLPGPTSEVRPTGHAYPVVGFPAFDDDPQFGMMYDWSGKRFGYGNPKFLQGDVRFYMRR